MRVSSDLSEVKSFEPVEKAVYKGRIEAVENKRGKNPPFNPYHELTWKIEGGQFDGREIRFDTVVYGGKDKNQNKIQPFRLAELLEAAEIPWVCQICEGKESENYRVAPFLKGTSDNGLERGFLYCPDCRQKTAIGYDTDHFIGKRCNIAVDVEKQEGSDRSKNVIKRYAPII